MVHPRNCVGTDGTVLVHGVDDSDDSIDKHLTYLSQVVDCHSMEKSKQNKRDVGNKDNGVDNSVGGSVDNSDDSANKHLTHLLQAVDCCLMKRSKQNKCVVGNKDDGVDDS
eukprot:12551257-Ditylum_brightwellii.AAC.1